MPDKPRLFVGSAKEHLSLVTNLQRKNTHAPFRYFPWTNLGAFPSGGYPLPALVDVISASDGAVFLALGADATWWRGSSQKKTRDNVVFEAGLAIGLLGLKRTAIVVDDGASLPSDLAPLKYISCELTGDFEADADDLHSHIEAYFRNAFPVTLPVLTFRRPEKFPELNWSKVAAWFPEASSPDVRNASELITNGKYSQAKAALASHDHLVGLYLKSRLALLCGDLSEAKVAAESLLTAAQAEVETGHHHAYLFFAIAARRLVKCFKSYDLVRESARVLSRAYNPVDLDHLRGLIELHQGRYQDALRYYDAAIAGGSEHIWSFLDKAECHYRLGEQDRIWDIFRLVQQRWPDDPDAEWLIHYLSTEAKHP